MLLVHDKAALGDEHEHRPCNAGNNISANADNSIYSPGNPQQKPHNMQRAPEAAASTDAVADPTLSRTDL